MQHLDNGINNTCHIKHLLPIVITNPSIPPNFYSSLHFIGIHITRNLAHTVKFNNRLPQPRAS